MKSVWLVMFFKLSAGAILLLLIAACRAPENTPAPPATRTTEPTKTSVPTATTGPTLTPSRAPSPTTKPTDEPVPVETDPGEILGIQWQWLTFKDLAGNNEIAVEDPEQFTLTVHPNGMAAVQTDCNQVSLGYVLDGSDLSFSAIGPATSAYCGEDSLDELYLQLLVDAVAWAMNDEGQLILKLKMDSGHLSFQGGEAAPPPEQPDTAEIDIIGRIWEWQAFLDTAGINDIAVDDPEHYTVLLQPDGQAQIAADCNELAWSYELKGSQLIFDGSETGTLTDCGDDSLDQRYLTLLSNVAEWFPLDDGTLYLNLWADGGSMVFAISK